MPGSPLRPDKTRMRTISPSPDENRVVMIKSVNSTDSIFMNRET